MPFDEIQDAVKRGDVAAGLLIHEGPADLPGRGAAQDRRPRRVVGGADRRAAAAAGRQRDPPRPRAGADRAASAGCCTRASSTPSTTARQALDYAMQFGRGLDRGQGRSLRRDVREQPHARLHRRRAAARCSSSSTRPTRRASSRRASPSSSPERFAKRASDESPRLPHRRRLRRDLGGRAGQRRRGHLRASGPRRRDAPLPTAARPAAPSTLYQGRRSFAQQGEDLILYNLLWHDLKIERPSYLDIGAGDPVLSNNTYALYLTGSRGVLVEPNPTLVRKLKAVRPGDVVVGCGVGLRDTTVADYYVIRGQLAPEHLLARGGGRVSQAVHGGSGREGAQDAAHPDQPADDGSLRRRAGPAVHRHRGPGPRRAPDDGLPRAPAGGHLRRDQEARHVARRHAYRTVPARQAATWPAPAPSTTRSSSTGTRLQPRRG